MSYAADGRQYVSILVGYGGAAAMSSELSNVGWKYDAPRRLLTFVLDGRAKLPPAAPPNRTVKAVDDPNLVINPADVAMGKAIYIACGACHGRDLVSAGGPAPDLRESRVALDPVAFRSVVQGGALIEHGMPRFTMLSGKQIDGIWAYIRQGARDARAARK
jgi:quinohemoprotein ethanol dehydrogenase